MLFCQQCFIFLYFCCFVYFVYLCFWIFAQLLIPLPPKKKIAAYSANKENSEENYNFSFSITTSSVPKFVQVFWNYFAENAANLNVFQKKRNIFTQKYWKKTNWERVWAKRMQTCPKRSQKAFLTKRLQNLVAARITEMWTFCEYLRRQLPLRQKHNSEFWERIVKFKIPAKT